MLLENETSTDDLLTKEKKISRSISMDTRDVTDDRHAIEEYDSILSIQVKEKTNISNKGTDLYLVVTYI